MTINFSFPVKAGGKENPSMNSIKEVAVRISKTRVPLGSLLVAHEVIMPHDLDFALEHQRFSKLLLGEILVRIGALNPDDLDRILQLQGSILRTK